MNSAQVSSNLVRLCAARFCSSPGFLPSRNQSSAWTQTNQRLFRDAAPAIQAGLRDQVIIESHVPTFDDGPSVIRFERGPSGETVVTRAPAADEAQRRDFDQRAKSHGAEAQWVTRDGYTQLPEIMRRRLEAYERRTSGSCKGQRTPGKHRPRISSRRSWRTPRRRRAMSNPVPSRSIAMWPGALASTSCTRQARKAPREYGSWSLPRCIWRFAAQVRERTGQQFSLSSSSPSRSTSWNGVVEVRLDRATCRDLGRDVEPTLPYGPCLEDCQALQCQGEASRRLHSSFLARSHDHGLVDRACG